MLAMGAEGRPISILTLSEHLRRMELYDERGRPGDALAMAGGPAHLTLILETAAIETHLASYIAIVRQMAILREVIRSSAVVIDKAYDAKDDVQLVVDQAREAFEQIAARAVTAEKRFKALRLDELRKLDIIQPWFLVEDWIPGDLLTFLVGDSEGFKSWLAKYIGFCVAAGIQFFGRWKVTQAPVLIISEENGVAEDRRRADLIFAGLGLPSDEIPLYIASDSSFSFDDPESYASMRTFVREHGIKLVIVDSFVRVHRREEKDAGEMNRLYVDRIKPILLEGVGIIALHHKRKLPAGQHGGAAADNNDDIRGSGDIRAAASAVVFLRRVGEKKDKKVVCRHNKTRGWDPQDPFVFTLAGSSATGKAEFVYDGKPEDVLDKTSACKEAILVYAAAHKTFKRTELEKYFKEEKKANRPSYSRRVFDPILAQLSTTGYPLKRDQVGSAVFYTYVAPDDGDMNEPGADDVPF